MLLLVAKICTGPQHPPSAAEWVNAPQPDGFLHIEPPGIRATVCHERLAWAAELRSLGLYRPDDCGDWVREGNTRPSGCHVALNNAEAPSRFTGGMTWSQAPRTAPYPLTS
ncbi:hypothetical protein GCM10022223_57740 [Kineosporia mesophila]|uniref:Uncharacterized protein n=1 Tax=Kineosporia mesophila TaxID=566012 RepID=A0ABP7AGQ3_9ACTN